MEKIKNRQLQQLEKAILEFRKSTDETLDEKGRVVIEEIKQAMLLKKDFFVPIEKREDGQYEMRTLSTNEGSAAYAVFTKEEEAAKGAPTEICKENIETVLEKVLMDTYAEGVMINPWDKPFFLPGYYIEMIFASCIEDERNTDILQSVQQEKCINRMEDPHELLNKAICFSVERHSGAFRKGTNKPYIVHPLETMQILAKMTDDVQLWAAGVLHDVLEDTDTTVDELIDQFGVEIASLVSHHTENKQNNWYMRKRKTIEDVLSADRRLKLLIMADKTANLRSMYQDYKKEGEGLWARFNAPKQWQAWYYGKIQDALAELQEDPEAESVYWEMVALYKDLFVQFFLDEEKEKIFQRAESGEAYFFEKMQRKWISLEGKIPENSVMLSRIAAEKMVEEWVNDINV